MGILNNIFLAKNDNFNPSNMPNLVSCTISKNQTGIWESLTVEVSVTETQNQDLDQAIQVMEGAISLKYNETNNTNGAEIQFVIYLSKPKLFGKVLIFDIEKTVEGYVAKADGEQYIFKANSLQELADTVSVQNLSAVAVLYLTKPMISLI